MHSVARLIWAEVLLQWCQPLALFFTLIFPPLLIVLFGYDSLPETNGLGSIATRVPCHTALGLLRASSFNLPFAGVS
ncbi:hypothetical protein HRbin28_01434 [bacterium HR28]|uniref:Uncharacterized protein n=1 Tax=Thermomicrobium roseum TaxID=500 RepID=A0A7C1K4W7_THERO|nr:hypothetical protein HRbin28_01434 [bacterium HR28]